MTTQLDDEVPLKRKYLEMPSAGSSWAKMAHEAMLSDMLTAVGPDDATAAVTIATNASTHRKTRIFCDV